MNDAMKQAWLEITQMIGEPTPEELHVFLRTWQKAIQAEREECAKVCESRIGGAVQTNDWWFGFRSAMKQCAAAIRSRGQA